MIIIAITKPIPYQVMAFDATKDLTIPYIYQGDQQRYNEITVYNSKTNEIKYQQKVETFFLKYNLPKNSLVNGVDYEYQITVYSVANVASPPSDRRPLICLDTPTFIISNLVENQVVRSSQLPLNIEYSQPQNELLDSFQVTLYDDGNKELHKSNLLYASDSLSYLLTSLLDNSSCYVQVTGRTVKGMDIATDKIYFTVNYLLPATFARVSLENIPKEGAVKIESNIIAIDGKSNPDPPIFINDEKVDLTSNGSWVLYDEGFSIEKDFAIKIDCSKITCNATFFELSDGRNKIIIQKWGGEFNKQQMNYFVLYLMNKYHRTRIISDLIPQLNIDEAVRLIIRKYNNLYSISCERKEVTL